MFSRFFARKETFRQLHALSDRELEDIGITRGDIRRVVFDM